MAVGKRSVRPRLTRMRRQSALATQPQDADGTNGQAGGGADGGGLARHALSQVQVVAQSVGLIGPSLSAATLIPLTFAAAGDASWLTACIATVGMLAVAGIIGELARRHVSMGALYTLIPKGLGPAGGLLAAGGLLVVALAGQTVNVIGFGTASAQFLNAAFGIGHSSRAEVAALALAGLLVATAVSLGGISVSTTVLLVLEGLSMAAISALLVVVLVRHGHIIDPAQLRLHGASVHGVLIATTFVVFAFAGFESVTALGVEAKRPRRTIPLAMGGSVAVVGVFFVVNAYVQVLGFSGTGLRLASQAVPLGTLAAHDGVGWLGNIVLLGVTLSWFGVLCGWLNYAPRPMLAMAREGVIPRWFKRTGAAGVPVTAMLCCAATWLAISLYLAIAGVNLQNAFSNISYLAGYGYTMLYLLVAMAAIGYALRHRFFRKWFIIAAVVAGAFMILAYWYSFDPLPAYPVSSFVYGFAAFVGLLIVGALVARVVAPEWLRSMGRTEEH